MKMVNDIEVVVIAILIRVLTIQKLEIRRKIKTIDHSSAEIGLAISYNSQRSGVTCCHSDTKSRPENQISIWLSSRKVVNLTNCWGLLGSRKKTRKKRKEMEQVNWINRTYLQNKTVSTSDRSVRPNCQVWLLVGICHSSHRPEECDTRPF